VKLYIFDWELQGYVLFAELGHLLIMGLINNLKAKAQKHRCQNFYRQRFNADLTRSFPSPRCGLQIISMTVLIFPDTVYIFYERQLSISTTLYFLCSRWRREKLKLSPIVIMDYQMTAQKVYSVLPPL
jgi:hypothetical protein